MKQDTIITSFMIMEPAGHYSSAAFSGTVTFKYKTPCVSQCLMFYVRINICIYRKSDQLWIDAKDPEKLPNLLICSC